MSALLEAFREEYDPGHNLHFDGIRFRDGAPVSMSHDGTPTAFGLVEGFRYREGSLEWGWMRFHMGTDRAQPPVDMWSPFDADQAVGEDDGGRVYGWLLRLISRRWGFETRIAHMNPGSDVDPWLLAATRRETPVPAGTRLGRIGRYGLGAGGEHSHTEVVSIDKACPMLDELLQLRWGAEALRPYQEGEILTAYRQRDRYRDKSRGEIIEAWEQEKQAKGIERANRFRASFTSDPYIGQEVTRYSSALLFSGL